MQPLVIIGTGLDGANLVRQFRKLDTETPLLVITDEDGWFYDPPPKLRLNSTSRAPLARAWDAPVVSAA